MRDPPSVEQKRFARKRGKGFGHYLVNRQTLIIALRALALAVRLLDLINRLFGDF